MTCCLWPASWKARELRVYARVLLNDGLTGWDYWTRTMNQNWWKNKLPFYWVKNFWDLSATTSWPNIIQVMTFFMNWSHLTPNPLPHPPPYTTNYSSWNIQSILLPCLLHQARPTSSLLLGHSFHNYHTNHFLKWAKHELTLLYCSFRPTNCCTDPGTNLVST